VNFFEAQDQARRATTRLVILFLMAVASLIALTELLVLAVMYSQNQFEQTDLWAFAGSLGTDFHVSIVAVIVLVVALGTFYKFNQLSAGGYMVAELVGGRVLAPDSEDPSQRRLLNVVEEMAIASGVPVPAVYVLPHEHGINAFAAGLTTTDAIICVTQGTLEVLDRDALQGVIAHEFSHILNGDMRLNVRITCVLNGILLLGLIGVRMLRYLSIRRGSSRGKNGAPVVLLGVGLMAIGFGGTFFGNMIKATVNRQREYLADASAVQFTRNPRGIAAALKAIAAYVYGSRLAQPNVPEISHFFFAAATGSWIQALFATHPPLTERIRRIEPDWDGSLPEVKSTYTEKVMTEELVDGGQARKAQSETMAIGVAASASVAQLAATTRPDAAQLDAARQILTALPAALVTAARNPYHARALICAMLLSADSETRLRQMDLIRHEAEPGVDAKLDSLYRIVTAVGRSAYLPLVQMAIPTLRACSHPQIERFQRVMHQLVRSDNHISLFEWCVMTLVNAGVAAAVGLPGQGRVRQRRLGELTVQVRVILALLAQADGGGRDAELGYTRAMAQLQIPAGEMYPPRSLHFQTVDNALKRLDELRPLEKQRLMKACVKAIEENGAVTGTEIEVLRAIAAALHVPAPPIVESSPNG